ncbi:hypothetical protein ACF0H5_002564 [Mactra antiquata]
MSETEMQQAIEQMKDFKASFSLFDRDGDGKVSKDELRTAMRSLGQNPTEDELNEIMNEVDKDGNGTIDYDEFVNLMSKRSLEVNEEDELRKSFKVFDKNGDGLISFEELKYVMTHMGERLSDTEVTNMLQQADTDGDGQINYEEFVRMMTAK